RSHFPRGRSRGDAQRRRVHGHHRSEASRAEDSMTRLASPMPPAFRSRRGAAAFASVLLALLGLPFMLRAVGRPTITDTYRAMRSTSGPFVWLEHETLEERSTVDLAFVGPSFVWAGVDTPLVQSALSGALGRPAVTRT